MIRNSSQSSMSIWIDWPQHHTRALISIDSVQLLQRAVSNHYRSSNQSLLSSCPEYPFSQMKMTVLRFHNRAHDHPHVHLYGRYLPGLPRPTRAQSSLRRWSHFHLRAKLRFDHYRLDLEPEAMDQRIAVSRDRAQSCP